LHSSVSPDSTRTQLLGARYAGGLTTFTVWAPDRDPVELVVETAAGKDIRRLRRDERGYWSGEFDDLPPGTLYRYRLNRSDEEVFPDPASRYQPQGVHGPSQVIDPATFQWSDGDWRLPPLERLTIYELHVGTFTPAGTFEGAASRLDYLAALGVTAIEIMPVGDFAGDHNWGYDGVAMFAPARCYGTPDSLRALVDAAHRHGLAVVLDVVYNHFGPDGAYANAFSPYYFSDRHESPWGRGLNFDGPHSAEVRRFFIENALQWMRDYHVDALRLDATHAIVDDTTPHFLAELTSAVRAEAGRDILLIAEDHRNLTRMLLPVHEGGYGIDAVWADDFHHQARVHTAGDRDGYYADFTGSMADLVATLRQGWFYTGQASPRTGEPRGTDPSPLDPAQFVLCLQNHDQVGNRFDGARLHHQIDPAAYRALSALLLAAPHTPMLFMGQEWAATTPFQFFTDHNEELGRQVTEGRRAEFASFESFGDTDAVPDPQEQSTFERSRLRWQEIARAPHGGVLKLYERLLHLRQSHPALQAPGRAQFDVRAVDAHTLTLRRTSVDGQDEMVAVVRLSGDAEASVQVDASLTRVLLTTEDPEIVESPLPIRVESGRVTFARPGAILLTRS
jgi:maltooligosyltrehalose trehalohydrolase